MIAHSLQSVSDQELEGAVKADVRQNGAINLPLAFKAGRPEAKEAEIGLLFRSTGKALERAFALEQLFRIGRQVARKGRDFRAAVECFTADLLAGIRRSQDRGQFVAATLHLGFAGGAHRGQRHHVDRSPGVLGAVGRLGDNPPQDGLQPIMARMMQVIGLGGGKQDAVDPRPE